MVYQLNIQTIPLTRRSHLIVGFPVADTAAWVWSITAAVRRPHRTACLSGSITSSLTLTTCPGWPGFRTQAPGWKVLCARGRDRHRDPRERGRRPVLYAGHGSERLIIAWMLGRGWAQGPRLRWAGAGPVFPMCDDRKTAGPAHAQDMRLARGYPSDLTDAQWQVIVPHLPVRAPGGRGRRIWPLRTIIEAILYLDRAGCAWRYLPDSFPPWRTVYGYFAAWRDDGTLARLHDALRAQVRAAAGRDREPTAAIIDSQSVRAADTVPRASRGWDNAKKVNGRKRHIAVDTTGLLLAVVITAASVQDRDAARPLLWNLHRTSRQIRLIWADSVYNGKLNAWAAAMKMTLQVVARRQPHAFEVLPRRWVVERTFAWISKHRRTVRDYEGLPASHEAMILWAMIALMARRLAQPTQLSPALRRSRTACAST